MGTTNTEPRPIKQSSHHTGVHLSQQPEVFSWQVIIHPQVWRPPTDVYETENQIVVRVEIAGMNESDFSVRLDRNHLSISGVRQDSSEPRAFHRMEINFGEFISEIELLIPIDATKVEASYKEGFLTILLPKAQPKHLTIGT